MRILFINPSWDYVAEKGKRHNRVWPPLCLLNCATIAKQQGHDVVLLDLNAEPGKPIPADYDLAFVTSSALDRWQCPNLDVVPVESLLAKLQPAKTVLMGAHGTNMPGYFLKKFKLKSVVIGEPEATVAELCSGKKPGEISGTAYLKGPKAIVAQHRKPLGLSSLPVPDYTLLPMDKYYYELMGSNFMLFEVSRGCPFKCIYCYQAMYGPVYRMKPIANVKKEIEAACKSGVKKGYFIDLEFTVNKKNVEELCDYLIEKKHNFKWTCQTRADTIDQQLLAKMKKAGCTLIHFGVETGSPRIMTLINKRITLARIEEGIQMARKAGIETACFFMFGFPGETDEDMRMTIEFAKKLNPTYASFHTATIYPGTKLFDATKGKLKLPYEEAYTKEHSLEKLRATARKAFLEFYLRPAYIASRAAALNPVSWHKQLKLFMQFIK